MIPSRTMRIPPTLLLPVAAGLTLLAYYLILFTNGANPYLNGRYEVTVLTQAAIALAAAACLEVVRSDMRIPVRALAGALAAPLVLVLALLAWYGLRRQFAF